MPAGIPVVLSHGFPYDPRAYDEVVASLADEFRVIVPYIRGYGPTRFLSDATMRSGQQAAFGADLLALMDALSIKRAILGGYDWGGRAACVVSALHPQRVIGLATCGGYNIQDIANAGKPAAPAAEARMWYQYYFHGERGVRALRERRNELCEYLWRTWSPHWNFDHATFERSAASFRNDDFVDVVVHSYRVRYGLVAGDPAYDAIEEALAAKPRIDVPTIAIDGAADGVTPGDSRDKRELFGEHFEYVELSTVGHNVPQEAPAEFAEAVRRLAAVAR